MQTISIALTQAQRIAISAQRLDEKSPFGQGKEAVLNAIEHLGYVQIDTISVIERAHHHVLWSRVPDYQAAYLNELQTLDRKIFEYWSHAAAYLPFRDYRYCLPRMQAIASGKRHWFKRDLKVMAQVLDRIRVEGPLLARDFEMPKGRKSAGWFEWKPAKRALEQLFMEGSLMIRERRGFQKVFDLSERVIPTGVDCSTPSAHEFALHLVRQSLRTHGIASLPEMKYLRKDLQESIPNALLELEQSGEIIRVKIDGINKPDYFAFKTEIQNKIDLQSADNGLSILSPFDNFIIQRKRIKQLFEYDYQIECYVPMQKRKFGYFCLPLLWRKKLVGRIDVKTDRPSKTLLIQSLHWESGTKPSGLMQKALDKSLRQFAVFNGCEHIITST